MTDTIVGADYIVNSFLYRQPTRPTDLSDSSIVRSANVTLHVVATMQSYVAKLGRFAPPGRFELIKKFFSDTPIAPKLDGSGNVTYRTEADLGDLLGVSEKYLRVRQSQFLDDQGDFAERALIWNSTAFEIDDESEFWVDLDGTRHIENLGIVSLNKDPDNFDFESTDPIAFAVNKIYLQDRIDPYGIGRKVQIDLTGEPNRISYNRASFEADTIKIGGWLYPTVGSATAAVDQLLAHLQSVGIISPVDSHGRPYEYGTTGADSMSQTASSHALYDSYEGGSVFVSAGDVDEVTGSPYSDEIAGGLGDDTLIGSFGSDVMWGGSVGVDDNIEGEKDVADYSAQERPISVVFNGGEFPNMTVKKVGGGTDTLHSIEKLIGTDYRDTFAINGDIEQTGSINWEFDANGGGQSLADVVNGSGAASGLIVNITGPDSGFAKTRNGNGQIKLTNFHTQLIGSAFDDEITDNSAGSKFIDGADGDDVISVSVGRLT